MLSACAVALGAGVPVAASAAERARSHVSAHEIPNGLFGYVTSPRTDCAAHRHIVVLRQSGGSPDPAHDERVANTVTERTAGGYQWMARPGTTGRLYAKARSEERCRRSLSQTHNVKPGAGDIPVCPGDSGASNEQVCKFPYKMYIDLKYGESIALPCPGFGASTGRCHGPTRDGPEDWSTGWAPNSEFHWEETRGSSQRSLSWQVFADGGYLVGSVPGPGSPRWSIEEAGYLDDGHIKPAGRKWFTPDLEGKDAGILGGPFYLDYENRWWGADVFIWGYLFRKP